MARPKDHWRRGFPSTKRRSWCSIITPNLRTMFTMSSSHRFWKHWSHRTWGTLPSAAFSRTLDVRKRPERWEWSHSHPWSLQVLSTHLKFSRVTRILHARRFNFKQVFKLRITSSSFSTDEGLRVSWNVLLKYTSQWQKTALLSIMSSPDYIYSIFKHLYHCNTSPIIYRTMYCIITIQML